MSTEENMFPKTDIEIEKLNRLLAEVKCIKEKKIKEHEKKTGEKPKMKTNPQELLEVTRAREIQLEELSRRSAELSRALSHEPAVADSDRARLELAREKYEVVKELTGVKFEHDGPPGVVKGCVKNQKRDASQAFEVPEESAPDALWACIERAAGL